MDPLYSLVVEDRPPWQKALRDLITSASIGPVEVCSRRDTAVEKANSEYFDLLFVDLSLEVPSNPKDIQYEGIRLIEEVRRHSPSSTVVAYSAEISADEETSGLGGEAKKAGADVVFARKRLFDMSGISLREEARTWVEEHLRRELGGRVLKLEDDLRTRAAVEEIGERKLAVLVADTLPGMKEDRVRAIKAGYSGASVFSVTSVADEPAGTETRNIVKITRQESALARELRRRPFQGSYFDAAGVALNQRVSRRVGGWRAGASRQVTGLVPLSDYLLMKGLGRVQMATLRRLVDRVYIEPAKAAKVVDAVANDEAEYQLSWSAGASLDATLNDLIGFDRLLRKPDRVKAERVRTFLHDMLRGKKRLHSSGGLVARLHGDLHCDNVFVSEKSDPVVIDFERHDLYPRLFDIAALDVDLLLQRLDSVGGVSWNPVRVDSWTDWVGSLFPFQATDPSNMPSIRPERVRWLRDILISSTRRHLDAVTQEEYAKALLFQLARYMRFPSVPVPKKVLGVRLFVRLLDELHLM